jgi:hypothetical protein
MEIVNVWQKFKNLNEDILLFIKKYSDKQKIPLTIKIFNEFCKGLIK